MEYNKKYIGIDIGGSHIRVALIQNLKILDFKDKYISPDEVETERKSKTMLKNTIKELYEKILQNNKLQKKDIEKIGVCVPGFYNNGILYKAKNLNINKYELLKDLKEIFGENKIHCLNDAAASTVTEMKEGSLKGAKNALFIAPGTGIGGRFIINGKIVNKDNTEMGHVLFKYNGKKCNCGKKGCAEQYISIKALKDSLKSELETDKHIDLNALDYTDPKVLKIINIYTFQLASFLVSFLELFNLEKIVLGGSLSELKTKKIYMKLLKKYININKLNFEKKPKIELAHFKNNAGIFGAILDDEN